MDVADGECGLLVELALDGAYRLDGIGCAQPGIDGVAGVRGTRCRQDIGAARIAVDHILQALRRPAVLAELLLAAAGAAKPLRLHDQVLSKTIVEDPEPGADDSLWRRVLPGMDPPGKTHP